MGLLYESEYEKARVLCFGCAAIFEPESKEGSLTCPECAFSIDEKRYREFYRHAFYALRYGYQYRKHVEEDESEDLHYFLPFLGDVATFIALAAAAGVIGNATTAGAKYAIKRIRDQVGSEARENPAIPVGEEEVEKLIAFISDYEDGFENLPDRIKEGIIEEILADAGAENPVIANKLAKLLFENPEPTEKTKRQAMILYRDLARRSKNRSQKRPSTPNWEFWNRN